MKNIDYDRLFLMGCQQFRPDDEDRRKYRRMDPNQFESMSVSSPLISLTKLYTHPDKCKNPILSHRPSYDFYSFGIVLLEIGLKINRVG